MKYVSSFCVVVLCLSGVAWSQVQPTPMQPAPMMGSKDMMVLTHTPTESDVYCAGYMSDIPPLEALHVLAGAEGGLKQVFSDRDTVYLSRGAGTVVNPGGEYILVRPIRDPTRVELFEGQFVIMKSMG